MFSGEPWFAWLPVPVRFADGVRWAWLTTVWRETTTFADGTTKVRFYSN